MSLKSPLIERSDLQSAGQRTLYGVITLFFWALWLYLWLPLLALVAWVIGLEQAYKYMVVLGGYREFLRLLGIYGMVIALMGGTLTAWAIYNILRYGKRARRSGGRAPSLDQIAHYFKQDSAAVKSWRQKQRLYVSHDEHGDVGSVDILRAGTPVPNVERH